MLRVESLGAVTAFGIVIYFSFLQAPLTCPGIFEPRVFRSNGSSKLRSNDQASEVYRRQRALDICLAHCRWLGFRARFKPNYWWLDQWI